MKNFTIKHSSILIVDDEQANVDILTGLLEIEGYRNVSHTTDPRLVPAIFKEINPDIILLDLMMPHLSGFQVMELLKAEKAPNSYLPILMLTADISPETKKRALTEGANDFVSKPFDLTEVGLRIKNLLETRFLHLQLNNQNQILEDKVKQRTAELGNTVIELEIAKNKAEASDRLKTAFLNNISHEIRTPLNGILGFAPFVIQPDVSLEEKEEFLEILNFSGNRLMNTITDYMDISLIISGNMVVHPQRIEISSMLTNLCRYFQEACIKKNLVLKVLFPEHFDSLILKTDGDMLRKAVSKLLDNSVKFTKKGSITLGFELIDSEVVIFIKDTGKGIAKDAQEFIFEYFMQEDVSLTRGYEGSGLGLSIAKGMIQLLGGNIRLESTINMGTTVYLSLPNNSSAPSVKPKSPPIAQKGKLPFILIAEDDDCNFFYAITMLKQVCKTLRASNGQEAVDLCMMHPEISLILMDIKMPVMDGLEATRKIKSFRNDLPIIAVTAYAQTGDEFKFKEAGCDDYIPKPVKKAELLSLIQKYFKN